MKKVILVACVARKRSEPARADDMYTSVWFLKVRRLIERTNCTWFILSAKYGLVAPDQVIKPYNLTLNSMSRTERQEWARLVQKQMHETLPLVPRVVVLAGRRYREELMPYLFAHFDVVSVPMQGLSIGRQLKWLNHANAL